MLEQYIAQTYLLFKYHLKIKLSLLNQIKFPIFTIHSQGMISFSIPNSSLSFGVDNFPIFIKDKNYQTSTARDPSISFPQEINLFSGNNWWSESTRSEPETLQIPNQNHGLQPAFSQVQKQSAQMYYGRGYDESSNNNTFSKSNLATMFEMSLLPYEKNLSNNVINGSPHDQTSNFNIGQNFQSPAISSLPDIHFGMGTLPLSNNESLICNCSEESQSCYSPQTPTSQDQNTINQNQNANQMMRQNNSDENEFKSRLVRQLKMNKCYANDENSSRDTLSGNTISQALNYEQLETIISNDFSRF